MKPMDDLLQPTLQDQTKLTFKERPYSPRSQFFVTFFGGVAAGWFYSILNTKLLKAERDTINRIHLIWAIATLATLIGAFVVATQYDVYPADRDIQRYFRYGNRIVAVLTHLLVSRIQDPWYKRFAMVAALKSNVDEFYQNPWKMGLLAVLLLPVPHGILMLFAIRWGDTFFGAW